MKDNNLGVIIGRFQTPFLTPGHKYLFDYVLNKHSKVLVLIGQHLTQPTNRNPLDFETRKLMITNDYHDILIEPLKDAFTNELWSINVDSEIQKHATESAIIYGSRDSFISSYTGRFNCCEIPPYKEFNASELRLAYKDSPWFTTDFRRGVIYGIGSRFESPYLAVDVACIKDGKYALFGKKSGESNLRFIGGFVDSSDESITHAAARELHEETGITATNYKLIGEAKIPDWRYARDKESIFTNLFICDYLDGNPTAQDDIEHIEWVHLWKLDTINIAPVHKPLLEILIKNQK